MSKTSQFRIPSPDAGLRLIVRAYLSMLPVKRSREQSNQFERDTRLFMRPGNTRIHSAQEPWSCFVTRQKGGTP